jgi:peroxiredoxin
MSVFWQRTRLSAPAVLLRRGLLLLLLDLRAELGSRRLRLGGLLGALAAGVLSWAVASAGASAAVLLGEWLGLAYGCGACLWAGALVTRHMDRGGAILRGKPTGGALQVLVAWLSGLSVWLLLLAAAFLASMPALLGEGVPGAAAGILALARAALQVGMMGTLAFALSGLFRSPLAAAATILLWVGIFFSAAPAFLQPTYAQNAFFYGGAALLLLAVSALVAERKHAGELHRPLAAAAALLLLLLATACGAARALQSAPASSGGGHTVWDAMRDQELEPGQPAPGFWLPDGRGGQVQAADYPGKVLLIYLFAAEDEAALRNLSRLDRIAREYAGRGVQPLGICLSRDHGNAWSVARLGGCRFPIGMDLSTEGTSPPVSAMAHAYGVPQLPALVVTDRWRRVRALRQEASLSLELLRALVEERLAGERLAGEHPAEEKE